MNLYEILGNLKTCIVVKDKNNNIVWCNSELSKKLDSIYSEGTYSQIGGNYYDCLISKININNEEYIIEEFRDVTGYKNKILYLEKDFLTGLYTKNKIYQKLEKLNEISKERNSIFSIVMGDIDFFKSINDEFGHLSGDDVLKYVSQTLVKHVDSKGIVGRFGGEEFIIILPCADVNNAYNLIEEVRNDLYNNPVKINNQEKVITMTFGISSSNGNKDIRTLIGEADKALYEGKNTGRNKTLIYKE